MVEDRFWVKSIRNQVSRTRKEVEVLPLKPRAFLPMLRAHRSTRTAPSHTTYAGTTPFTPSPALSAAGMEDRSNVTLALRCAPALPFWHRPRRSAPNLQRSRSAPSGKRHNGCNACPALRAPALPPPLVNRNSFRGEAASLLTV